MSYLLIPGETDRAAILSLRKLRSEREREGTISPPPAAESRPCPFSQGRLDVVVFASIFSLLRISDLHLRPQVPRGLLFAL